ncbi:FHA domain-containing protein, partial [Streptomyces scabiei]|uniref:FHA domain-containing protein FhaB/FipA n=1 Tax=Streptomyces scabiei TaxID=1930 RepID=UPI0029AEAD73
PASSRPYAGGSQHNSFPALTSGYTALGRPPGAAPGRVRGGAGGGGGGGGRRGRNAPTKLVVSEGTLTGTTVALQGQTITLGRAHDSTIVLDDDYASSRHARIYPDRDGQWIVEDLGSTNGTYLDRNRLTTPTPIPLGAPIRIGKTVIELRK